MVSVKDIYVLLSDIAKKRGYTIWEGSSYYSGINCIFPITVSSRSKSITFTCHEGLRSVNEIGSTMGAGINAQTIYPAVSCRNISDVEAYVLEQIQLIE